jgi:hypothetical protein
MSVVGTANLIYTTGGVGEGFERRYTSIYQVQTDARTDLAPAVLAAPGLPQYRNTYPTDGGAFATDIQARPMKFEESLKWWEVTVKYSSKSSPNQEDQEQVDDPLLKPVDWSGSFVQFQEAATRDRTGNAIVNTAGDRFDPPAMKDNSMLSIVAVKNYAALDFNVWSDYADAVNSDVFLGLDPRKVKVRSIEWDERFHGSPTPYYEVRFTFLIKNVDHGDGFVGHDFSILNEGFREKIAANAPKMIKDAAGNDIAEPHLLRSDGQKADLNNLAADTHYVKFRVYKERPFAALGLPGTTDK